MSADWPRVPLGEVLRRSENRITLDPETTYSEVTVRLWGQGVTRRREVVGAEIAATERFRVRPNQFIVSRIDARNGAFGLIPDSLNGAVVTNDFPVFDVAEDRLEPRFLHWLSKTADFVELCKAASEGTTNRVRLREDKFLTTTMPLPPLAEQRGIVARVEAAAARIAEARHMREETNQAADSMMGSARRALVKDLSGPNPSCRLEEVCLKITDGPHVSPTYVDEGVPFISVRNIGESGLDFSTAKYVSLEDHREFSRKANVEFGDVLYTKGGTTGVARRVDVHRDFSIWVHVALLKLNRSQAEAGFIEHILNSPQTKDQAEAFTRGSSNRDLGLTRMAKIVFPLPPLREQRQIVAHLDALQAQVDALRTLQSETAAELDALLPAVLAKAFAGEL
jgi:type I restriction enzyme S subunit